MKQINLSNLFGRKGILCAVEGYKFRIGDLTFEAILTITLPKHK